MELSSEQKRNAILENGFFFLDDAVVGQSMERMDEEGIPLASAGGFLFCKANVLENPVSKGTSLTTIAKLTFPRAYEAFLTCFSSGSAWGCTDHSVHDMAITFSKKMIQIIRKWTADAFWCTF